MTTDGVGPTAPLEDPVPVGVDLVGVVDVLVVAVAVLEYVVVQELCWSLQAQG